MWGVEDAVWMGWRAMNACPAVYALATRALAAVGNLIPAAAPLLKQWTRVRSKPKFAAKTLHQLAREKGYDHE